MKARYEFHTSSIRQCLKNTIKEFMMRWLSFLALYPALSFISTLISTIGMESMYSAQMTVR